MTDILSMKEIIQRTTLFQLLLALTFESEVKI